MWPPALWATRVSLGLLSLEIGLEEKSSKLAWVPRFCDAVLPAGLLHCRASFLLNRIWDSRLSRNVILAEWDEARAGIDLTHRDGIWISGALYVGTVGLERSI